MLTGLADTYHDNKLSEYLFGTAPLPVEILHYSKPKIKDRPRNVGHILF
jgi:hypothetical protein